MFVGYEYLLPFKQSSPTATLLFFSYTFLPRCLPNNCQLPTGSIFRRRVVRFQSHSYRAPHGLLHHSIFEALYSIICFFCWVWVRPSTTFMPLQYHNWTWLEFLHISTHIYMWRYYVETLYPEIKAYQKRCSKIFLETRVHSLQLVHLQWKRHPFEFVHVLSLKVDLHIDIMNESH